MSDTRSSLDSTLQRRNCNGGIAVSTHKNNHFSETSPTKISQLDISEEPNNWTKCPVTGHKISVCHTLGTLHDLGTIWTAAVDHDMTHFLRRISHLFTNLRTCEGFPNFFGVTLDFGVNTVNLPKNVAFCSSAFERFSGALTRFFAQSQL